MHEAVQLISNYSDFIGFCKTPDLHPSTLCEIKKVEFSQNKNGTQFCFEITANRFLRGMIRNLMARIILVGSGEITLENFKSVLEKSVTEELPILAPPQGLHLSKIIYPYLDLDVVFDAKKMLS